MLELSRVFDGKFEQRRNNIMVGKSDNAELRVGLMALDSTPEIVAVVVGDFRDTKEVIDFFLTDLKDRGVKVKRHDYGTGDKTAVQFSFDASAMKI